MPRLRSTLVSILLPALLPFLGAAQGPLPVHPAPVDSPVDGQNSPDGLRLRLQDLLNAAKDHDAQRLKSLIQQLEIPDYQDWFTKTFSDEIGKRGAEQYGRNFADGDTYLEALFTELAGQDGEWIIHKPDPRASGGEPGDNPPAKRAWRGPKDLYVVSWKNRELSASPRVHPVGTFALLDGSFRIVGVARLSEFAPGRSSYPNIGPVDRPGNAAEGLGSPSGGGSDQRIYRTGAGGVGYPSCVYCPDPEYSNAARKRHLEGVVILQAIVQPDGSGTDIQVVKSPDPELTQMAIDAVSKWRFDPARNAVGEAVPVHLPIEVNFRSLK